MTTIAATEADVLRCGYEAEHFNKSHIIAWADRQIDACDTPSDALINLSLCRNAASGVVASNLRSIGSNDATLCVKLQIAFLGLSFSAERVSLEQAVRALYRIGHDIANENGVDDDQRNVIYHLDDGYDLAVSQTHGSLAEIERKFEDFVRPYIHLVTQQFAYLAVGGE